MEKRFADPKTALEAALSPATSEADLRVLASAAWNFVRDAVATNPSTPPDVLTALVPKALVLEDDFRIAGSLLQNTASPREIIVHIARLAESVIPQFQPRNYYPRRLFEALASNPLADVDVLATFLDPACSPTHLRKWMARLSMHHDVLCHLASDRSETVRKRATKRLGWNTSSIQGNGPTEYQ